MKDTMKGFVLGAILGSIAISFVTFAVSADIRNLTADFCGITIDIDRNQLIPKDATGKEVEPFIIDGTTYLPIRAIAEAFDKEVVWWDEVKNVCIYSKSEPVIETEVKNAFVEVYLSNETIKEYKINSVRSVDINTWAVSYSILPADGYEIQWMAGNGEGVEDGWIINKGLYVYVVKTDGVVELKVLGTGLQLP